MPKECLELFRLEVYDCKTAPTYSSVNGFNKERMGQQKELGLYDQSTSVSVFITI